MRFDGGSSGNKPAGGGVAGSGEKEGDTGGKLPSSCLVCSSMDRPRSVLLPAHIGEPCLRPRPHLSQAPQGTYLRGSQVRQPGNVLASQQGEPRCPRRARQAAHQEQRQEKGGFRDLHSYSG